LLPFLLYRELERNVQTISASIEAVCRKTLQEVNRDSGAKPTPKISVKNYMSAKVGWAVGFIDWLDAFIRHSSIE
jgi:hypothetical protein